MARKSSKSKKLFVIVSLLLIIISAFSIGFYFYFDNKIKEYEKENGIISSKNDSKEKELKDKKDELESYNQKLKEFDNINVKIQDTKKEYYSSIKELEDLIRNGKSDKKIAYLTFDDGPYYNTYKVLDILEKYDVRATFFTTTINGENCYDKKSENCFKLYPEYLKRGHTIANHTFTHAIWRGLYKSADSFMEAVINQENHVKEMTGGYVTNIVRFPGGSSTAKGLKQPIIERLREKGYGWVDWNAQDGDGGNLTSTDVAWSNFKNTINEDIEVVLFHDYSSITTAILPKAIEYLQENGYVLFPLFYDSVMINK